MDHNLLLESALVFNELARYQDALALFEKLLVDYEENDNYYYHKSVALYGLSRFEDALQCLNLGIKINEFNPDLIHLKYLCFVSLSRFEEAKVTFDLEKTVKLQNKSIKIYHQGLIKEASFNYLEAIKFYNKAIELDCKYHYFYTSKGLSLIRLDRLNEAILNLDIAIDLIFSTFLVDNFRKKEIASYEYNLKGHCLFYLNRFEDSIQCLFKTIEINDKNSSTYELFRQAFWNLNINMG